MKPSRSRQIKDIAAAALGRAPFVFLIYLALAALSLRHILLALGTLGHNWDAPIPADAGTLRYVAEQFSYSTWYTLSLGMPKGMMLVTMWNTALYSLPAYFGFDGAVASKAIHLLILTLGAGGTFLYLLALLGSRATVAESGAPSRASAFGPFLGGLFYGFSPFLFNDLQGGALTTTLSYAFVPLAFYFAHRLLFDSRWRWGSNLGLGVVLAMLAPSAHYTLLVGFLLAIYAVLAVGLARALRRLLPGVVLAGALSAPWLLPLSGELAFLGQTLPSAVNTGDVVSSLHSGPSLLETAALAGYFNRPFYLWAIPAVWTMPWAAAVIGMLAFIAYQCRRPAELSPPLRLTLFWLGLLFLALAVAAVGDHALGWLANWLYSHIAFMINFRSYQRLMVLPTIALAVLIALAVEHWQLRSSERRYTGIWSLLLVAATALWGVNFWTGDLGLPRLGKMGAGNHLDQYRLAPSYEKSLEYIQRDREMFRVLTLPLVLSPRYLPTEYQSGAQGGDPTLIFAPRPGLHMFPGVHPSLDPLLARLQTGLTENGDGEALLRILRALNVKYVLLRRDVVPDGGAYSSEWKPGAVDAFLRASHDLTPRVDGAEATLFEVRGERQYQLSAVQPERTAPCDEAVAGQAILRQGGRPWPEYCTSVPIEGRARAEASPLPRVSTLRLSDTRYLLTLEHWRAPTLITLQEGYNPLWRICPVTDARLVERLRRGGGSHAFDAVFEDWPSNCVDDTWHMQVNGYANGWLLDPAALSKKFPAGLRLAAPGEWTGTFVVEYRSQRRLEWGLLIAAAALLVSVAFSLFDWFRHSHANRRPEHRSVDEK